jgi:hypothetical protein
MGTANSLQKITEASELNVEDQFWKTFPASIQTFPAMVAEVAAQPNLHCM